MKNRFYQPDYIFGYTCALDITVLSVEDRSTRKSFDTFIPLSPCVVTTDEIDDPHNLELPCWVNGVLRQQNAIFYVARPGPHHVRSQR